MWHYLSLGGVCDRLSWIEMQAAETARWDLALFQESQSQTTEKSSESVRSMKLFLNLEKRLTPLCTTEYCISASIVTTWQKVSDPVPTLYFFL